MALWVKANSMETFTDKSREERLNASLREWRGVDPSPHFEAMVWRRIRAVSANEPFGSRIARILLDTILPHPVWATALAATVAILLGVSAGLAASPGQDHYQAAGPLLHSQTLAGSYLAMTAGEAP
jgi:hypothetical protein